MCDPVSAAIATAVGTAASLAGTYMGAQAQKKQAAAISEANQQTLRAQNQGFTERIRAGVQQTGAQTAASQETINARNLAATQMRGQQMQELQRYQDTLNAQNTEAERLRATGDAAAQNLLAETSGPALAQAEEERRRQAAALLEPNLPESPEATSPNSRDPGAGGASARRVAEAATNIRTYGSKLARAGSYGAAPQAVNLEIADTKYGIMPAQNAEQLLRSGSDIRLLPSKVGYQAATGMGQAQDLLISSRGQNALDAAGLSYGNATSLANLGQANTEQAAKNTLTQTEANLKSKESQAKMIQGVGQLGLYGAGMYYGGGNPLSGLFGGISSSQQAANAAGQAGGFAASPPGTYGPFPIR